MTRLLLFALTLPFLFSSCNTQTKEDKERVEQETLIALKKWFDDPSLSNNVLDPKVIRQLQDSGRIENGFKEGLWNEYSLDTTSMGQQAELVIGDRKYSMTFSATLQKQTGQYAKGKKTGVWTLYDARDISPPFYWNRTTATNYKDGSKDGKEIIYQGYGVEYQTPLIIRHWKNDVENGIGEIYDVNSPYNLQKRYKAIDGQMWILEAYYPSRQLQIKCSDTLISGKALKHFKEYSENGKLNITGYYENGEEQFGIWTNFYANGKTESISNYKTGKLDGSYKYFHDNGELWTERIYKNGNLIDVVSNYDRQGKKNNPGTIKNGTGTLYIYGSDGQLIDTVDFVDGQEKEGSR